MIRSRVYFKVLGNFGFLLVVLVALTVLVINILNQMEVGYTISASDLDVASAIDRLNDRLVDVPDAFRMYLATGSEEAQTTFADGWKTFDLEVIELEKMTKDSSTRQTLDQVKDLFFSWVNEVAQPQLQLRSGEIPPDSVEKVHARILRIEAESNYLAAARSILSSLYEQRLSTQAATIERSRRLSSELSTYFIAVNVLFALFAIALGFVLTRSITKPLTQLKAGTQSIMEGKFANIEVSRRDEFGDLADDFNRMSSMLRENYTRVSAYSDMMTTLNKNETLSAVINESLNLLCQQSGAAIGALYLFRKEENILELSAGYALQESRAAIKRYKVGDGIPGQCAKLLKPIEVSDIPNLVQFPVETGLTTIVPKYIFAFPVLFQDNLAGVLLLGATKPLNEITKEVISSSLPQIGVAIVNAQNYEAAQELTRELTEKHAELNSKNAELEKAYKVKSDFLSNMSHELRTPLNSIIGFTSILLGERGDPLTDDQRRALEKVLRNGRHLLQLINDILDFSKIEAGRMHVSVEDDTLESVVSTALVTAESLVRQKSLDLKQRIEPNLPMLHTDTLKVKQIIVNLLSNAAKFTDSGTIEVSAYRKGEMVAVDVKDSGIGISKENQAKIFEEFQQIDSSHSRKYKGTGLGLPIARRLAQLLGGDLTVESELGKGSTFTLTLPPVIPKEIAAQAIESKPSEAAKPPAPPAPKPQGKIIKPPEAAPVKPAMKPAPVLGRQKKVLCIDDEPDVVEILRSYLVPEGYTVYEANSGDDGIGLALKERPDVITLDIMMPQKDGWQVLRELKSNEKTRDIPVLIHSIIENKPLMLSLGALDYLPKPADRSTVLSMVEKAADSKERIILIVDDDLDYSSLVQSWLKEAGYKSQIANDGYEALAALDKVTPSLIMLDMKMPGMDGFQVLEKLKQNDRWRKIPVVIVSGVDLPKEQLDDLNRQMIEFLRKGGVTGETITQYIKKVLA